MGISMAMELRDDLLEMDHGGYVGRRRDEVYTDEVKEAIRIQGKDFAWPGGESMNAVGKRGCDWLHDQEESPRPGTLVVIGHGVLFSCMVSQLMDWDQPTTLAAIRSMPPVGEARLSFDGNTWSVDAFAEPVQAL